MNTDNITLPTPSFLWQPFICERSYFPYQPQWIINWGWLILIGITLFIVILPWIRYVPIVVKILLVGVLCVICIFAYQVGIVTLILAWACGMFGVFFIVAPEFLCRP
jgi:hypothetical protein